MQNVDALYDNAQTDHGNRRKIEYLAVKEHIQSENNIQKANNQVVIEHTSPVLNVLPGMDKIPYACYENPKAQDHRNHGIRRNFIEQNQHSQYKSSKTIV